MRKRAWLKTVLVLSAVLAAGGECLLAQNPPAVTSAESLKRELAQLQSLLTARDLATQPADAQRLRDEAARRLVSRGTREANDVLRRVLNEAGNREGQLAVAKALASAGLLAPADDRFIEPLFNLLGVDPELTGASALALTMYKDSDRVRTRLTTFSSIVTMPVSSRTAVIRAMGRLVDKRAAGWLVQLLNTDTNSQIRDAATDALIEMTGLSKHGRDVQQWNRWWEVNRNKPDVEWAHDLLNKNATRANELEKRLLQVREQATRLIRDEYQRTAEADRARKLSVYLQSDSEDIRYAAVQIAYEEFSVGRRLPQVLEMLRGMVGDASAEVRGRVARTLGAANDRDAVTALLAQLPQEKDPDVRAAIVAALGPTHDLNCVSALLARLDDESFSVARAAAEALGEMASVLRDDANKPQAALASQQFLRRLRGLDASNFAAAPLRLALVQAMSRLGQPSMLQRFYELISPEREGSERIRMAAYRGLAAIGNPDSTGMIMDALQRERDAGVRLVAVEALGKTARTFETAQPLRRLLFAENERDPAVREKAWQVLESLFDKASEKELSFWAEQFKGQTAGDARRRLTVLLAMEKKLESASAPDRLATCRQNIGEVMLDESIARYDEAAGRFRQALDYWKASKGPESFTDLLMQELMRATLKARKFVEARDFATSMIQQNPANAEVLWGNIKGEIEDLRKKNDLDVALQLIDEVKKVPLGASYASLLSKIESEIRQKRSAGGARWVQQYGDVGDWLAGSWHAISSV